MFKRKDGKNAVLFKDPTTLTDRNSFDSLVSVTDAWSKSMLGLGYSYMESIIKDWNMNHKDNEQLVHFEKMVSVPCGCCRECLTMTARQWSFRILKEAEQHDENWFITFTYDDEHIPKNMMLDTNAISDFNKKLKTYLNRKGLASDFRFYGVGEYGSQTARPHYHVIYFGLPIPDLKLVCMSQDHNPIFDSEFIKNVWSNGFITIEGVSIGSAAYVARYCDKKKRLNKTQKEELKVKGIVPEFSRMSNRPGIGANYLDECIDRFKDGKFEDYINGKSYSYPMYYNKKIKELLKDTDYLEKYEEAASIKSAVKINKNLSLSDSVGSIEKYNDRLDNEFKSRRKL